jgi:hypothetical protein
MDKGFPTAAEDARNVSSRVQPGAFQARQRAWERIRMSSDPDRPLWAPDRRSAAASAVRRTCVVAP